jgi:hypothetical protein
LDREGVIDHIELISAPNTNLSRLYAAIRINSYKEEYSLFKSEDYGHHFVYLSNEVRYATESRSDANLMIGYTNVDKEVNCWISISNDGGRSWRAAQYDLLNQDKVFQDNKRRMLRTGYEDEGDIELPNAYPVKQIETDPNDARTFYVFTWTGIYATGDLGKTFIHLPIATGYYNGVDNMAVDPIDSHIIYAIVKGSELYRSQDKGCTWRKLQLPTE